MRTGQVKDKAVTNWWRGRKVLVTGGAGFIGSNLVWQVLRLGAHVRVIDNLERGRTEYLGDTLPHIDFRQADLRSAEVCRWACQGMELVIHLASKVGGIRYYMDFAGDVFRENTLIDLNVWSAAMAAGVPYYFYASSAHVYPGDLQQTPDAPLITEPQAYPANPELAYGWAKLQGEKLIQYDVAQGCPTRAAIGRIIGAYGPNQDVELATGSAIPVFCRRAYEYPSNGPFAVLGTGVETRSYHFVTDTVEAILRSARELQELPCVGPFNLGAEERITIGDLVRQVIAVSGKDIEVVWDKSFPTLIWGQAVDCSLAAALLDGWRPQVSLQHGLAICYEHISARLERSAKTAALLA